MMGSPRRRRRLRRLGFDDGGGGDEDENERKDGESRREGETELAREIESIIRRRRRNSTTVLQLLQNIRASAEYETGDQDRDRDREGDNDRDRNRDRDGEREAVIMINPFNQTIITRGGSSGDSTQNSNSIDSLGGCFVGPCLALLLQHLAENYPNRYGTPPAQKEAVEAMPTVTIEENLQCSVCLDDFEIGSEAKEMPCKHKFHPGCILPWLELHSSCAICQFQLPSDESKLDPDASSSGSNRRDRERDGESEGGHGSSDEGDEEGRNGNGKRFSIRWPFLGFFSSSRSGEGNSTASSSSTARFFCFAFGFSFGPLGFSFRSFRIFLSFGARLNLVATRVSQAFGFSS